MPHTTLAITASSSDTAVHGGVISNFLFFVISMNAFVLTTLKEEQVVHELIRSTVFKGHCEIES